MELFPKDAIGFRVVLESTGVCVSGGYLDY